MAVAADDGAAAVAIHVTCPGELQVAPGLPPPAAGPLASLPRENLATLCSDNLALSFVSRGALEQLLGSPPALVLGCLVEARGDVCEVVDLLRSFDGATIVLALRRLADGAELRAGLDELWPEAGPSAGALARLLLHADVIGLRANHLRRKLGELQREAAARGRGVPPAACWTLHDPSGAKLPGRCYTFEELVSWAQNLTAVVMDPVGAECASLPLGEILRNMAAAAPQQLGPLRPPLNPTLLCAPGPQARAASATAVQAMATSAADWAAAAAVAHANAPAAAAALSPAPSASLPLGFESANNHVKAEPADSLDRHHDDRGQRQPRPGPAPRDDPERSRPASRDGGAARDPGAEPRSRSRSRSRIRSRSRSRSRSRERWTAHGRVDRSRDRRVKEITDHDGFTADPSRGDRRPSARERSPIRWAHATATDAGMRGMASVDRDRSRDRGAGASDADQILLSDTWPAHATLLPAASADSDRTQLQVEARPEVFELLRIATPMLAIKLGLQIEFCNDGSNGGSGSGSGSVRTVRLVISGGPAHRRDRAAEHCAAAQLAAELFCNPDSLALQFWAQERGVREVRNCDWQSRLASVGTAMACALIDEAVMLDERCKSYRPLRRIYLLRRANNKAAAWADSGEATLSAYIVGAPNNVLACFARNSTLQLFVDHFKLVKVTGQFPPNGKSAHEDGGRGPRAARPARVCITGESKAAWLCKRVMEHVLTTPRLHSAFVSRRWDVHMLLKDMELEGTCTER